jgi:hypothetical protein
VNWKEKSKQWPSSTSKRVVQVYLFDPNPGPSGLNNAPSMMNRVCGSKINNVNHASVNARNSDNVDMFRKYM